MPRPDLLTPFFNANKNRSETFMVNMNGFFYNRSAAFVINMLSDPIKWLESYPNLKIFFNLTAMEIFNITKYFNPAELLLQLSNQTLDVDNIDAMPGTLAMIEADIEYLDGIGNSKHNIIPVFAYAFTKMMEERCCRKAYITKSKPFTPWEKDYIATLCAPIVDKIELLSGYTHDIYDEYANELTTVFLTDTFALDKIAQNVDKYKEVINNQLFMILMSNNIAEISPNDGVFKYTCTEKFEEYEKLNIHASVIQNNALNPDDPGFIIYKA